MPARPEDIPFEGQALPGAIPNFVTLRDFHNSDKYENDASSVRMLCTRGLSETSTVSVHSYINYRKLVNNNLAKISNNISEMMIESFKGIDSLCSKVRECISDFHPAEPPNPTYIPAYTESFADDAQTQKLLAKRKESESYADISSRYEQYRNRNQDIFSNQKEYRKNLESEANRSKEKSRDQFERSRRLEGKHLKEKAKSEERALNQQTPHFERVAPNLFEEQTLPDEVEVSRLEDHSVSCLGSRSGIQTRSRVQSQSRSSVHSRSEVQSPSGVHSRIREEITREQTKPRGQFKLRGQSESRGPSESRGQSESKGQPRVEEQPSVANRSWYEEQAQSGNQEKLNLVDGTHGIPESLCLIESVISFDKTTLTDDTIGPGEELEKDLDSTDHRTTTDLNEVEGKTQFYTEIEFTGKSDDISEITELSVNEIKEDRKKSKSKIKRKLEKQKKRRNKKSLEDYRQAVTKEVDNADFTSLQAIIQNLTERIDVLSNQSMEGKCETIKEKKKKSALKISSKTSTVASTEPRDITLTIEDEKTEAKDKNIKDLITRALTSAFAKRKSTKHGKPRYNLTEVYHRPGVTNIHKRLLAQLEANDSFLCFQRLMSKHKEMEKDKSNNMFSKINLPLSSNSSIPEKNDKDRSRSSTNADQKFLDFQEIPLQEKQSQKSDLRSKYADSLWFNEDKMYKEKSRSNHHHHHHHKDKKNKSVKPVTNYSTATIGTDTDKSNTTGYLNRHSRNVLHKPKKIESNVTKSKSTPSYKPIEDKKTKTQRPGSKRRPYTSHMNLWFSNIKKKDSEKPRKKKPATKSEPSTKCNLKSASISSESSVRQNQQRDILNRKRLSSDLKLLRKKLRIAPSNSLSTVTSSTYCNSSNSSGIKAKLSADVIFENRSSKNIHPKSKTSSGSVLSTGTVDSTRSENFLNKEGKLKNCDLTIKKLDGQISNALTAMCQCGVTVSNDANQSKTTVKTKIHWMRPKNETQMPLRKLEYLDILDDLTHKDLLPLRSEYPRKDLVVDEKLGLKQNRDIQETYLWKMMYGKEKNDNIWSHLLQPNVDCTEKGCHFCEWNEKDKWVPVDDRLRSAREFINRDSFAAKSGLFDLSENKGLKKLRAEMSGLLEVQEKPTKNSKQKSKRKTIEKLAPYLFDPREERNNQTLIVMPVRVFYDNPPSVPLKENEVPEVPNLNGVSKVVKTAKLPRLLLPAMKEVKPASRAKWTRPTTPGKPKRKAALVEEPSTPTTVRLNTARFQEPTKEKEKEKSLSPNKNPPGYDPRDLPKTTPQQVAYKKAILRNVNRMMSIRSKDRKKEMTNSVKEVPVLLASKTLTPHYARPTIQSQNHVQKVCNQIADHKKEAEKYKSESASVPSSPKKPAETTRTSPKVAPQLNSPNEFEIKNSENKTDFERKMLSFKYGKSVGEQLVSFLNHQPPSPDLLIMPNSANPTKCKFTGTMGSRYSNPNSARSPNNLPLKSAPMRHRQMLMHLKGLKQKNTQIQTNIQKAINVIETKMVDILSGPGDSGSVEAFDVMEKEITKVLEMMKTEGLEAAKGNRPMIQEDFETISKELESKLERILDSERSKESTTTVSETDGTDTTRSSIPDKPKLSSKRSTEKLIQSSSVTTTSADETMTVARRNVKRKTKKFTKSDTKLVDLRFTPPEREEAKAAVENEFAMGENVSRGDSIGEHIFDRKEDIERDQGDQPERDSGKKREPESDLNVIWDTAEQLQRLEKILKESENEESDAFEKAIQREQEKALLLEQLRSSAPLDSFDGAIEEEDEQESKDQLDFLNLRINALLESPRREEISVPYTNYDTVDLPKDKIAAPTCPSTHQPPVCHLRDEPSDRVEDTSPPQNETICPVSEPMLTSSIEEFMTPPETEVKLSIAGDELLEEVQNSPEMDEGGGDLGEQVNKIIRRVEDIYAQLDEFQISNDEQQVPIFSDTKNVTEVPSDEFLTPFMHAVRDKRTNPGEPPHVDTETTPSFYNILNFLDTLNEIDNDNVQEVYSTQLKNCTPAASLPKALHQAGVDSNVDDKHSCFKKHDDYKHKKKVSFLVLKENKSAQATISPHSNNKYTKTNEYQDNFPLKEVRDKPTSVSKEVQNVDESKKIQVGGTESSDMSDSINENAEDVNAEDVFFAAVATPPERSPRMEDYCNASDESISEIRLKGSYGTRIEHLKNSRLKTKRKPKIGIMEISSVSDLLRPPKNFEKISQHPSLRLVPSRDKLTGFTENSAVLLKSFYAFMYIVVFTALNMEYKCY